MKVMTAEELKEQTGDWIWLNKEHTRLMIEFRDGFVFYRYNRGVLIKE